MATGADLLFRVASGLKLPPAEVLPDGSLPLGDQFAAHPQLRVPDSAVRGRGSAARHPYSGPGGRVHRHRDRGGPGPGGLPADHHDPRPRRPDRRGNRRRLPQRWEYEIALKEIETQMLEPGGGLRSKSPELVRQELWGLLLAHYAIRSLMAEAANQPGLIPTGCPSCEVSTSSAARSPTRRHFPPGRLTTATAMAITEILERVTKGRRKRTYPRVIKKYKGPHLPSEASGPDRPPHNPVHRNPAPARRLSLTKWHWERFLCDEEAIRPPTTNKIPKMATTNTKNNPTLPETKAAPSASTASAAHAHELTTLFCGCGASARAGFRSGWTPISPAGMLAVSAASSA